MAREAAAKNRKGLEFLIGIPGTIGGALRMNAGALGSEIWDFVEEVETIDSLGNIKCKKGPNSHHVIEMLEDPLLVRWC